MSVLAWRRIQLRSHWVLGLKWPGHEVVTSFIVVLRLRMSGIVHLLPIVAHGMHKDNFIFYLKREVCCEL